MDFAGTEDKKYKKFWPADLHVIGKDILRFHAIYWPAFLMATKLPLPKRVFGHGWILSDDKKMSKSLGNILDPLEIIENFGIDQLRYYLIKEVSLGNDGSVSMKNLKDCINNDLANNYGNLCQRVFSFIENETGLDELLTYYLFNTDTSILLSPIIPVATGKVLETIICLVKWILKIVLTQVFMIKFMI